MDDVFMDMLFLGDDDGFEVAGRIEMEAEGTEGDIVIADIVEVIKEKKH
jgi:hypothetical protein